MTTGIIDALVVTFALDATGFAKGEHEVDQANKRLRESNKHAFDEMEKRGKSAAVAFKSVRNEVIGLGLAFMGATSIVGLIGNMMTGAAAADRLGQTMGMSAKQVWAWRMAMKEVGGQPGEGDAALSTIQKAKMGWQLQGDTGNNVAYSRLGVSGYDLQTKDPGEILKKIAGMQGKMSPQLYASLLQQIGLPASTIYFLQQGKDSVDKLIRQFEDDAKGQQELAKSTEALQKSLVTLEATISKKLVPPLIKIANFLNTLIGGAGVDTSPPGKVVADLGPIGKIRHGGQGTDHFKVKDSHFRIDAWHRSFWDPIFGPSGGAAKPAADANGGGAGPSPTGKPIKPASNNERAIRDALIRGGYSNEQALGIMGGLYGESKFDPNIVNPKSGAFGIGQWLGSRKAELFRRYGQHPTLGNQIEFLLWELHGGDPGHGGKYIGAQNSSLGALRAMIEKFERPKLGYETQRDLVDGARYIAARQSRSSPNVHIGTVHVHTKATDAKGIARDLHGAIRRHAVAHADRGVAP